MGNSEEKHIIIRQARLDDTAAILAVKQAVWPEETNEADNIAAALQTPPHQAYLALVNDHVAGFVSCFTTKSATGETRWEVDLLAVHPDFRRRGLAAKLVERAIGAGRATQAAITRALIEIDNIGSQRSFARHGYQAEGTICTLYISTQKPTLDPSSPRNQQNSSDAHFVFVDTFSYSGIWVEDATSPQALLAAQAISAHRASADDKPDVVGVLIPADDQPNAINAQQSQFEPVGQYQRWRRIL